MSGGLRQLAQLGFGPAEVARDIEGLMQLPGGLILLVGFVRVTSREGFVAFVEMHDRLVARRALARWRCLGEGAGQLGQTRQEEHVGDELHGHPPNRYHWYARLGRGFERMASLTDARWSLLEPNFADCGRFRR